MLDGFSGLRKARYMGVSVGDDKCFYVSIRAQSKSGKLDRILLDRFDHIAVIIDLVVEFRPRVAVIFDPFVYCRAHLLRSASCVSSGISVRIAHIDNTGYSPESVVRLDGGKISMWAGLLVRAVMPQVFRPDELASIESRLVQDRGYGSLAGADFFCAVAWEMGAPPLWRAMA